MTLAPPWRTLVDARSLAAALADPSGPPIVLLDVRHDLADPEAGPRAYAEGHLPGAWHAHMDRDLSAPPTPRSGRHPLPDMDVFLATCSRWGIDVTVQVVAYDDRGGIFASRAWWLLRDYGHVEVAVLDGGIQAWAAAGLPLTRDPPAHPPRRFRGRPGHMETVSTWDLLTRAPRRLVDSRAPERYRGDDAPQDRKAGHIMGAQNLPTGGNLDERGFFLSPGELRARFEAVLSGLPPREAAVYCGSGITAPHNILAMEVAGLRGAKLYPGSWSEWVRDPFRPVQKGDEQPAETGAKQQA